MNYVTARLITAALFAVPGVRLAARASDPAAPSSPADEWNRRMEACAATNAMVFFRPGVWAERGERAVYLLAEWSDISTNEPVEFVLVGPRSGHDYEALAVSRASPAHIREALDFIGVPAGAPIDYSRLQLWPRGERIAVSLQSALRMTAPADPASWIPAERFVLDSRTGKTLPEQGFVYSGSVLERKDGSPDAPAVPAAEITDPYSIISLYNEPRTMLDVPRQSEQGAVYGSQTPNPACAPPAGALMEVRLQPLPPGDGSRSVCLSISAADAVSGDGAAGSYRFDAADERSEMLLRRADLPQLLALFGTYQTNHHDLYVTVRPDAEMTLASARRLFAFFQQINTTDGARLSPGSEGELYYKAFLPDMRYADRAGRPNQPWELYLQEDGHGSFTGRVELIEESWTEAAAKSEYRIQSFPVASPEALKQVLNDHPDQLKVIFIFAPDTMTCGQAQTWYRAVYPEYKTIYFYPAP